MPAVALLLTLLISSCSRSVVDRALRKKGLKVTSHAAQRAATHVMMDPISVLQKLKIQFYFDVDIVKVWIIEVATMMNGSAARQRLHVDRLTLWNHMPKRLVFDQAIT